MTKRNKLILGGFTLFVVVGLFLAKIFLPLLNPEKANDRCSKKPNESTVSAKNLAVITPEELKNFDGETNSKIYIGLDCLVYDVTSSKNDYYGPGKPYHYLVARDASAQLKIFGGDIIKSKYPVVGVLESN